MYVVSGILFLLPSWLLAFAWARAFDSPQESAHSNWRTDCVKVALVVASLATLASMAFIFSWLHDGGDPHGWGPSPGLWQTLRPVFELALEGTVALAIFGKGKGRLLLLGWALADAFVVIVVFVLAMD